MNHSLDLAALRRITGDDAVSSEVLYIAECSEWGKLGYEIVAAAFPSVLPIYWSPGMPKPDLSKWEGDWIISFKSDLLLSLDLIDRAKKGAINFHPSPPKYRGVGGYWWALHNGDDVYGVTCHHMNERIDHGDIIATESFAILPEETEESLRHRAAIRSLTLLTETVGAILSKKPLASCGAKWADHLYTYKELALAKKTEAAKKHRKAVAQSVKPLDTKSAFAALEAIMKEDQAAAPEQANRYIPATDRRVM